MVGAAVPCRPHGVGRGDQEIVERGGVINRVENVENVEWGACGPSNGRGGSPLPPAREWPWRTWRINSEERQKASLTLRLNAPQVPLINKSEQVFRETASRSGCRGGRQGTAAPTMGLGARRAAGDCRPYHGVGGAACEASGGTLVEPLSPVGVC